ncbi:MAG TPA: DUF5060 domain-containing protein [Bryobacteraceae bacterium]|nr:DUF5060 domain-containing protein [Bryobacteraceae bacterium]
MIARTVLLASIAVACSSGQTICQPTPAYSPCEIVFEMSAAEAAANPNPYRSVTLEAEFRSPRYRTFRMPAFWDGGNRLVLRFTPTDPGNWAFRISSSLKRFDGFDGQFSATESKSPGFLKAANVHHWAYTDDNSHVPHLWMGDTLLTFPWIERKLFEQIVDARAAQKFNHIRGVLLSPPGEPQRAFASADQPDLAAFREIDERVRYMNAKGIIADLVLAWTPEQFSTLFPTWEQRERYLRYLMARYAALDVTWQLACTFESSDRSRVLLRETGQMLRKLDVYGHPRSTGAAETSAPLLGDEWMDYAAYGSADNALGSIEHQLYATPFVNLGFASEDSGAGRASSSDVDTDTFRHRLWNSTMSGQYPTFSNTGTSGAGKLPVDAKFIDSPGARQMSVWFDFFSRTRHWELEPYFEVDGGRAVALERPRDEEIEGVEYIVYVEKPGPVEIVLPKHTYDIEWFNPANGESVPLKKFKADRFTGEPPEKTHDWVLHISREGRKESLRSYKFESRAIIMQELEQSPTRVPFQIVEPAADAVTLSHPPKYQVKVTRETRATRSMMWLWTGEVAAEQQGYRVLGTDAAGTFRIPGNLSTTYPVPLAVRLYGMNAHGKVYSLIRVYQLTK